MRRNVPSTLALDATLLKPGLRLAVGLSGGADSVALLCALAGQSRELGLVLHAAHLHHGLRGAEADGDLEFARALARKLGLPFHEMRVDTKAEARAKIASGKPAETIEEAARRLRYGWFRELMAAGAVEAVATAHTRDDQAETVLAKFLRGAWTEGFSGIYPVIAFPEGRILRPLLGTTRAEVEAYLGAQGQGWREDSTNRHLTYTRNRIRHELLPLLEGWNPQLREHLAQMAVLARDEEAWWQAELARLAPQLILPGRPVRGGGRASGDGLALDVTRLAGLAPALQRRLLRHAAERLGAATDFSATEALREMALAGRAGQRLELAQGLRAERTARELRMMVLAAGTAVAEKISEYNVPVPGEVAASAFGVRLRIESVSRASLDGLDEMSSGAEAQADFEADTARLKSCPDTSGTPSATNHTAATTRSGQTALLRNWRPGDRVHLRYSSGPRKVKEVLERLKVTGSSRGLWPVVEYEGRIVWMQGVEVEPEPGIRVVATPLTEADATACASAKK